MSRLESMHGALWADLAALADRFNTEAMKVLTRGTVVSHREEIMATGDALAAIMNVLELSVGRPRLAADFYDHEFGSRIRHAIVVAAADPYPSSGTPGIERQIRSTLNTATARARGSRSKAVQQ